jgi:Rrf2 family protein
MNIKGVEKIGIKQIAGELDIPTPFLGKILQLLAKHKLLSSTKGPHGGFGLSKDPYEISMLEVIEIIDGLDFFNTCLVGMKICKGNTALKNHCPLHTQTEPIRLELTDFFTKQTIGDLAKDIHKANKKYKLDLMA